jgi:hypothetical protein
MALRRKDRPGTPRWQKATAVVPLALLAAAWTASLGHPTTATADSAVDGPAVPVVPTTPFDQPANYTDPSQLIDPGSAGVRPALDPNDPSTASSTGIPTAALTAYRRAAAVLADADPGCHLSWALVAAIGRIESDHGRYGDSVLGSDGKATPPIYGLPLNGSRGRVLIKDTDDGALDGDATFDRAVGPMQFIPSTWDIVGVDGDGDGRKDPQDIDDAALGTAVYLCAGTQDLSTTQGQRSAVFSYNHSEKYVDLVLAVMNAYLDGDFATVADGLPESPYVAAVQRQSSPGQGRPGGHSSEHDATTDPGQDAPPTGSSGSAPHHGTDAPATSGGDNPSSPADRPSDTPSTPTGPDPAEPVEPVVQTLSTLTEATQYCAQHLPGDPTQEMISACGEKLVGKTVDDAEGLLSGTLLQVLTRLGLTDLLPDPTCLPLLCAD